MLLREAVDLQSNREHVFISHFTAQLRRELECSDNNCLAYCLIVTWCPGR